MSSQEGKTPYQGKARCFGEFLCPECNRTWMSANSWANTAQKCQNCMIDVYPYKQSALQRSGLENTISAEVRHPQHLCAKCRRLGRPCTDRY
ncbi:zinc finger CCHC domain-containing protein 24-like [Styela clava]|uniref:zinc finger CCHC domain-containing protein 24-like n=1 Tax=Styela clava TaxID=7725 RepID=UPI00193A9700|nr:zinc finger CCHC domain-containing protein 24-like [Styela clava]